MRINARLDESRSQKLEFLARTTHLSTSEILKQALDLYYEQVKSLRPSAAEALKATGFIGCGEAEPDLSERYKEEVKKRVATKHDHR